MIREIVKDMEDADGDASVGCRTLPLVVGLKYSRVIAAAILFVTILLLVFFQVILCRLSLYMVFWYFAVTVQLLAIYLMVKLWQARDKRDYHYLSSLCKLIMITGILSMEILFISQ